MTICRMINFTSFGVFRLRFASTLHILTCFEHLLFLKRACYEQQYEQYERDEHQKLYCMASSKRHFFLGKNYPQSF